MDDISSGTLKVASNAEVGDNSGYNKSSLKAYACESRLKRIFTLNRVEIIEYLQTKYAIINPIKIRIEDSKERTGRVEYEDFDVIELLRGKVMSFSAKTCLKLWDIYEEKGLKSTINAIHLLSPIQKI